MRAGRSFRVTITVTVATEWGVTERARVSLVTPELPVSCVSTARITRLQNVVNTLYVKHRNMSNFDQELIRLLIKCI